MLSTVIMSTPKLPSQQAAFGFGDYGHAGLGIFFPPTHDSFRVHGSVIPASGDQFSQEMLARLTAVWLPAGAAAVLRPPDGEYGPSGLHTSKQLQGGSFSKEHSMIVVSNSVISPKRR